MEAIQLNTCLHCGNEIERRKNKSFGNFCCQGCETVYSLLLENGLENFYQLRGKSKNNIKNNLINNYEHLDDPKIQNEYGLQSNQLTIIQFFLEGIHCLGCQYLLENLHRLNPSINASRFDFSTSTISLSLNQNFKLSEIAKLIHDLGYTPHLIKEKSEVKALKHNQRKTQLVRIALAAACSGNIMLLAIASYAGAEDFWVRYFDSISGLVAIPAIFYSAIPFYENSYQSIKQKRISIDFPISLAIIFGSIVSYYSLFFHQDKIYFDSITGLIFLLLSSRYLQKVIEEKAGHYFNREQFFENEFVHFCDQKTNITRQVLCEKIIPGDIILVKSGEMIPFDGKILRGQGHINQSLLTGESAPKKVAENDLVYQGTINAGEELLINVTFTGTHTRINRLLKEINTEKNSSSALTISDKIGRYFLFTVMTLGFSVLCYFGFLGQWMIGAERAITLFIVTCPCALAIGTPLSFRQAYQWLFKRGIILKNIEALEKVLNIKKIFVDKTGTLTTGNIKVLDFSIIELDPKNEEILYSLEKRSQHPIAKALVHYLEKRHESISNLPLENFKEVAGIGVEGKYKNNFFEVKGFHVGIALFKNGNPVIQIKLGDSLRTDAFNVISELKSKELLPVILSGDQVEAVAKISDQLQVSSYSNVSPEKKAQIVKSDPFSMMIGDGANDSLSLKEAYLGICMRGGLPLSMKVSDVYLLNGKLSSILDLITVAEETQKLIKRNLILSLFYNVTAATLACAGLITPMLAAIFMPLSSLTVILSNVIGTKKMRLQKETE